MHATNEHKATKITERKIFFMLNKGCFGISVVNNNQMQIVLNLKSCCKGTFFFQYMQTEKTVEEALESASAETGVSIDELIYVVSEEKKGIFSKKATIQVFGIEDAVQYGEEYLKNVLESLGIEVFIGHKKSNVDGASVVVVSSAIHKGNPEVDAAIEQHIPVVRRAEMLGELMRYRYGIAGKRDSGSSCKSGLVLYGQHPVGKDLPGDLRKNTHSRKTYSSILYPYPFRSPYRKYLFFRQTARGSGRKRHPVCPQLHSCHC